MPKPIYVLNGPNLNLLGSREPEIYGTFRLQDINDSLKVYATSHHKEIVFQQSNFEGQLIDWVHEAGTDAEGLIINPGAYSHTSIALLDAILSIDVPCVEVHLTNIFQREEFRQHSYISMAARGVICGFGAKGYELAFDALQNIIKTS
ncbi:MAG: type II 3-dehydroquinate dehydratase [Pseudomonadota bacterium]